MLEEKFLQNQSQVFREGWGGAGEVGWGIAEQLPLTGVRPRRGPEVRSQVRSVRLSSALAWDPLA